MKKLLKSIRSLVALTRINEYWSQIAILTILGHFSASNDLVSGNLIVIFIANLFSNAFAFILNDIEDYEDDAKDPKKLRRNPISNGAIKSRSSYIFLLIIGAISLGFYLVCGFLPIILGIISIILATLYSWKKVRLKSIPIADFVSHSLFLSTIPYLAAYFAKVDQQTTSLMDINIIWFTIGTFLISTFGCLYNQFRDYKVDRLVHINNTAKYLGRNFTGILMWACLALGIGFLIPSLTVIIDLQKFGYSVILSILTFSLMLLYELITIRHIERDLHKDLLKTSVFFALVAMFYLLLNDSILQFILGF